MSFVSRVLFMSAIVALSACAAFCSEGPYSPGSGKYPRFDSKQAEPSVSYGAAQDFPLPKTLLYSVSAEELLSDAETWTKLGFNGFFLTGVASGWQDDIWAADKEPWTIGESDKTFQTVRQANGRCRLLGCDVFLTMAFSRTFEWFNDAAWSKIRDNFRQFAIFGRETGCTGVAIDIEYIFPQYHFNWQGYAYQSFTRKELVEKVHERMTSVAAVMYDEFPDMTLLTLPEGSLALGSVIQAAWIEEAARRKAPGGVHICTEYTYRRPNIRFMLGHAWQCNKMYSMLLSGRGKTYWTRRCSIAAGLWPFGEDPDDYHGAEPSLDEFRQAFAGSLMMSRRYNWIYSHNLRPFMKGLDLQAYAEAGKRDAFMRVIAEKHIAANSEYVRTARGLRAMTLRDYSAELGLSLVPTFAGPREEIEIGLMPCAVYSPSPVARLNGILWQLGERLVRGDEMDLAEELGAQTRWMVLGPFGNKAKSGYAAAYPPENGIDINGEYEGESGKVRWSEYRAEAKHATVDLAKQFQPSEEVCAYALCYVTSAAARDVQIRAGANDAWKLWIGGKLAYENSDEGRAILDRDIVSVTLPAGTTPILLKVCNNRKDWAFIFRVTDSEGKPVRDLEFQVKP